MIKKIKLLIQKYNSFIKFCLIGVTNTVISLFFFNLLIQRNFHYSFATTFSYVLGIANGYILNSRFVFNKRASLQTMYKFIAIYLSALVINLIWMFVLVDMISVKPMYAQIFAIGFNVLYNYILNKRWTFKENKLSNTK